MPAEPGWRRWLISTEARNRPAITLPSLSDPDPLAGRIAAALALSPADATEILCFEGWSASTTTQRRQDSGPIALRAVTTVHVTLGRRRGCFVVPGNGANDLADAVRLALADARAAPPRQGALEASATPAAGAPPELFDPAIEALTPDAARSWLFSHTEKGEWARLAWSVARWVGATSQGGKLSAGVTGAFLNVQSGRGASAGTASSAARTLEGLDAGRVVARARARVAPPGLEPGAPQPEENVVLAPEAAALLLAELRSLWLAGESLPSASAELSVTNDALSPEGLPWPTLAPGPEAIGPLEVVTAGRFQALPAFSQASTCPLSTGAEDALHHLFVQPGGASEEELLAAAEGGLWVAEIESAAPLTPGSPQFLARPRGCRRIREGQLAEPVPVALWQDDLFRVLRSLTGRGSETVLLPLDRELSGGLRCPALGIARGGLWLPIEGGAGPEQPESGAAAQDSPA